MGGLARQARSHLANGGSEGEIRDTRERTGNHPAPRESLEARSRLAEDSPRPDSRTGMSGYHPAPATPQAEERRTGTAPDEARKELESARSYIEGLEEECRHFAKELHDGTANDLLALEMKARTEKQASMAEAIKQVRENVRTISHELMPPEFESLSLNEILSQYARSLTGNTGVRVSYNEGSSSPTPPDALPQRTAREVYRIVQEITMNVIKHTDASSIGIRLTRHTDGNIFLQITDNGHPIYPNRPQTEEKGIGLRTISDRAKAIRATIENQTGEKENRFIMTFKIESNEREFV